MDSPGLDNCCELRGFVCQRYKRSLHNSSSSSGRLLSLIINPPPPHKPINRNRRQLPRQLVDFVLHRSGLILLNKHGASQGLRSYTNNKIMATKFAAVTFGMGFVNSDLWILFKGLNI